MEGRAEPRHFPHTAAVCRSPCTLHAARPVRHRTRRGVSIKRRKSHRTGRARRARARSLREREGKLQTSQFPLFQEEQSATISRILRRFAAPPCARTAARALYAPAPCTHTRCTPVTPRTLHRRASVPRVSHTRATRPVSFAHRRAAREAKAARALRRRAITGFQRPAPSTPLASARPAHRALYTPASRAPHTPAPRVP